MFFFFRVEYAYLQVQFFSVSLAVIYHLLHFIGAYSILMAD